MVFHFLRWIRAFLILVLIRLGSEPVTHSIRMLVIGLLALSLVREFWSNGVGRPLYRQALGISSGTTITANDIHRFVASSRTETFFREKAGTIIIQQIFRNC